MNYKTSGGMQSNECLPNISNRGLYCWLIKSCWIVTFVGSITRKDSKDRHDVKKRIITRITRKDIIMIKYNGKRNWEFNTGG